MTTQHDTTKLTILVNNRATPGLLSEHGFSVWIETGERHILFDTGQGPALAHNASALGIPLHTTDLLVLSHGHYDHTGGLPHVLERAPAVHLYAHPAVTTPRYSIRNQIAKSIAMPEPARRALEGLPAEQVHFVRNSAEIAAGMGIACPIPRLVGYEDTGGPFFVDPDGTLRDPIVDDLALWIATDRGLVLVMGCGHAGLVNTLNHVQRITGEPRLRTVIGGFHIAVHEPNSLGLVAGVNAICAETGANPRDTQRDTADGRGLDAPAARRMLHEAGFAWLRRGDGSRVHQDQALPKIRTVASPTAVSSNALAPTR